MNLGKNESKPDTYGEFYSDFVWEEGEIHCLLSLYQK